MKTGLPLRLLCTWLVVICWVGPAGAQEQPVNLLPNGDFEQVAGGLPTGWTKSGDGQMGVAPGMAGNNSLQLTAQSLGADNGNVWATSPVAPVTGGKTYLLVFWAQGPAVWPKGADAQIYWNFRKADGAGLPGAQEYMVPVAGSYAAGKWQVGHFVVRAPAEAASVVLTIHVVTSEKNPATLQFDGLRLTDYQPPEPGANSRFYASATFGVGGDQITDPQSTTGRAWDLRVGKHQPGGKISGPLISDQEPGLYRAVLRLKIADNTIAKPVVVFNITGDNLVDVSQTAARTILATDFARPNEYQEFPVEFIRSPLGGLQYLVTWSGITDTTLDGVKVQEEKLLTDLDWVSLYGLPQSATGVKIGTGALVCHGLGEPYWHLESALRIAGGQPVDVRYFYTGAGGQPRLKPDFPQRVADLAPYSVVILADVPADALGFMGRQALRQFVEAGGGLLITGGYYGYGRGGIARSFLEDVLPVKVTDTWDLAATGAASALQPAKGVALPSNLAWTPAPQCLWLHRVELRPGAKPVLKVGDQPFLVVGSFGQGRVAACTGTILGKPAAGKQPFWEWRDWPKVMYAVIDYLRRGRNW
ncbi:MAG TPA: glutamine amidotransferase [Armatimonadota bacterium]|jgi:uncharacterized membrane protein